MPHTLGPLTVETLFYREADPGLLVEPHAHRIFQWYCCLHGTLTVTLSGNPIDLGPEESVLVRPSTVRTATCKRRAPGYIVAIFDLDGLDLAPLAHRKLRLPTDLRDDLRALVSELRQPTGPETVMLTSALLLRLVIGVVRANRTATPSALPALNASDHRSVADRAEAWMGEHLHRSVRRSEIAAAVHLSEPHLARVFRAATNRSVVARLTELRIQRAKALLLESTLSVTAIAGEVGFSSFSHFAQLFRRHVGVTPSDYRRTGGQAWRGTAPE